MMDDLEALTDQVCRLRAELATAKAQLATARRDTLLDTVNEVQQAFIDLGETNPKMTVIVEAIVKFLREQAAKETP